MAKFFPLGQVMGFIFSLVLTVIAMLVYYIEDMQFSMGMAILLVTAFLQAGLQFVVFMHAGESKDKWSIYANILYGVGLVVITILGTLLILHWDM